MEAAGLGVSKCVKLTKRKLEEIGKRYGSIVILKFLGKRIVSFKCDCGEEKNGDIYDIKRGRIISCGCSRGTEERRGISRKNALTNIKNGSFLPGSSLTKETKFKYLFKCINNKVGHKKNESLTIQEIEEVWVKQEGRCAYTGVKLLLPTHTLNKPSKNPWEIASVDRIDSSMAYCKNNIQFVSRTINLAKSSMTHEQMLEFISFVKDGGGGQD